MKILFATLTMHDEPLGIMYLSTILKNHGHQVRGVMLRFENIFDAIEEFKPDIVGYSAMDCERMMILDINSQVKKKYDVFSIIGGPLATFSPDVINDKHVDAICRGEGEEAFLELIEAMENKGDITSIKNIWIKIDGNICKNDIRPLINDLNSIHFPDRTLFSKFKKNRLFNVISSRGCPFDCTYCHNKKYRELYGIRAAQINYRDVSNLVAELKEINNKLNPAIFWFQEDHFYISVEKIYEFAKKYNTEVGKPFICSMRPEYLVDEERVKVLKEASCISIFTGCEAGNDRVRKLILKRNITKEQLIKAADVMRKYGIKFVFQNMIGIPTSTFEDDIETLELNIRCKPYYAWASICTPYPGTELYQIAQEAGCLPENYLDNLYETYHYKTSLNIPHANKVDILHKIFAVVVEYPDLLPIVKNLEFYNDMSVERIKNLKKVFDAFKEYKYASLSESGLSVPDVVIKFVKEQTNKFI